MKFNNKNEDLTSLFGKEKDESFNFELISRYFRGKEKPSSCRIMSDRTCEDLNFDDLFMFIDRTSSKTGQQYLYDKLRTIPEKQDNENNERIISLMNDNVALRNDIQKQLSRLNKYDSYYIPALFQDSHLKTPRYFNLFRLLSVAGLGSLLMMFFNSAFFMVFFSLFLVNLIIHYWNKKNLNLYLSSVPQLLTLHSVAVKLYEKETFRTLAPELQESLSAISKLKKRMLFFRLESKLQGDLEAMFWGILELFKIAFLLEPILLFGVLKRLDKSRQEVGSLFKFVGHIDMLISIASLRAGSPTFCIPGIADKNVLSAKNVYHPLISDCVPNNIILSERSVLLTGSNMSGKTSFIRTIGINVLTGLTINTCFAESMTIPDACILSAIRISDDLLNDKSYYFEEVQTIKKMIDNGSTKQRHLFLLDEIFKGTNTLERIAAGKAVLSFLANNENMVFVSTHDIELADMLSEEFDLYHFSEVVSDGNIDFDYKLKPGKLKNRNAIRILEMNGYPEKIINEALKISQETILNSQ